MEMDDRFYKAESDQLKRLNESPLMNNKTSGHVLLVKFELGLHRKHL